jgi:hypothetical protein
MVGADGVEPPESKISALQADPLPLRFILPIRLIYNNQGKQKTTSLEAAQQYFHPIILVTTRKRYQIVGNQIISMDICFRNPYKKDYNLNMFELLLRCDKR